MTSTAQELLEVGKSKPHGTRSRYVAGCRCDECRAANTAWYHDRVARMREAASEVKPSGPPIPAKVRRGSRLCSVLLCPGANGAPCVVESGVPLRSGRAVCRRCVERATVWDGLVSASRARAHLLALRKRGVGLSSVADASDVARSVLLDVATGRRREIRASTERSILAVDEGAIADGAVVSAKRMNALIRKMLDHGFSKAHIAELLGMRAPQLHLGKSPRALARTVSRVERLWARVERGEVKPRRAFVDARREGEWLAAVLAAGVPPSWLSKRLGFEVWRGMVLTRTRPARLETIRRVRLEVEAMTVDERRAAWPRYDEQRFDEALGRTGSRAASRSSEIRGPGQPARSSPAWCGPVGSSGDRLAACAESERGES